LASFPGGCRWYHQPWNRHARDNDGGLLIEVGGVRRKIEENPAARIKAVTAKGARQKFAEFADHWSPRIVGELNGQHVKLVKFAGEFVWHHHEHEDELFLVVKGRFRMDFRDRQVWLEQGELLIVPRGVEHRPVAVDEVHVLLFEPAATLNTGNVSSPLTVHEPARI
jgi:mannose-6-phosphate isomerase-like protein (cupin superfamily)